MKSWIDTKKEQAEHVVKLLVEHHTTSFVIAVFIITIISLLVEVIDYGPSFPYCPPPSVSLPPGPDQRTIGRVTEYAVSAELTADPEKLHVREEIILDRWPMVRAPSANDIKEMFDADTVILTHLASSDEEVLVISATVKSHPVTLTIPIQEKQEKVTILQEREVTATDNGFLMLEASIVSPSLRWGVSEGSLAGVDILFTNQCDSVKVDVTLPADSFHDAQHAVNIQRNRYGDTETITWTLDDLRHGVVFSYVPPPYNDSPIPSPLFGLESMWGWIMAIGLGIAAVVPSVVSVLVSLAKSRLGTWLEARFRKKPKGTARLIVSGTGEEKEIEID